jgi:hypothetical protein
MFKNVSIIYVSAVIDMTHNEFAKNNSNYKNTPAQNFHLANINAIANHVHSIYSISNIPKITFNRVDNLKIYFRYITSLKNVLLKFFKNIIWSFLLAGFIIIKNNRKRLKTIIFYDPLTTSISYGTILAAFIFKKKKVAICTDLIKYFANDKSLHSKYYYKVLNKSDGLIMVTEKMNEILNPKCKPFIIMEGIVDFDTSVIDYRKKSNCVVFTGTMNLNNGTIELIRSFRHLLDLPFELELYGAFDINAKEMILNEISKSSNVHYCGVIDYLETRRIQNKSYLLVNPRLTTQEYTLYSFPIKLVEYVSSGTVVISTLLPCLIKDYTNLIYIFNDESEIGFASTLRRILSLDYKTLENKANLARKFMIEFKNGDYQAIKMIELGLSL